MQNVGSDPSQYSSSELATVDHIRDEAKKLYSLYIGQKVKFRFKLTLHFWICLCLKMY